MTTRNTALTVGGLVARDACWKPAALHRYFGERQRVRLGSVLRDNHPALKYDRIWLFCAYHTLTALDLAGGDRDRLTDTTYHKTNLAYWECRHAAPNERMVEAMLGWIRHGDVARARREAGLPCGRRG